MDENLTRGYCQLRSETSSKVEIVSSPPGNGRGRHCPRSRILPPLDSYRCIYLALVLCGIGFLLPYNSFITAVDYYQAKHGPGTTIIFDMSLTYICVAFIGVVINNVIVDYVSLRIRITIGYVLSFGTLLLVAVCDVSLGLFPPAQSYQLTLVAVATVALGCTVQQSSFYGYTSMLPPRYTQAVMTGESAAGLIVSINRILTKILVDDVRSNTIIFLSISILFVFVCCVVFHLTRRTDFVRFYVGVCKTAKLNDDQRAIIGQMGNAEEVDILDGNVMRDNYGVLVVQSPTSPSPSSLPESTSGGYHRDWGQAVHSNPTYVNQESRGVALESSDVDSRWIGQAYRSQLSIWDTAKNGFLARYEVSKFIWPYMVSIGLAYFVTLSLFPGIESEVSSCQLRSWMPVLLISVFNLFDFLGKVIASVQYDWPWSRLVLCSLSRLVIVPLMMLCAAPRDNPVLTSEVWSAILSGVLGVTNGYFGSVPMILAPSRVPDKQKELTGNIMTLSYSLGLTTGSAVAYLLNAWLGPHSLHDHCQALNTTTGLTDFTLNRTLFNPIYNLPPSDIFPG